MECAWSSQGRVECARTTRVGFVQSLRSLAQKPAFRTFLGDSCVRRFNDYPRFPAFLLSAVASCSIQGDSHLGGA